MRRRAATGLIMLIIWRGLKSVTDPFGSQVIYTSDKAGRLIKVGGTAFGDNTSGEYVDDIKYRAFGQVRQLTYKTDDNNQISMQYDNRLRVSQHQTSSASVSGGFMQKAEFTYFADSSPQAVDNQINADFDRTFQYDFAGRLTANQFGVNSSNVTPYSQTLQYDPFRQITNRSTMHWNNHNAFSATYLNGRKQPSITHIPLYDAAGNMLNSGTRSSGTFQVSCFDAANRESVVTTRFKRNYGNIVVRTFEQGMTQSYDGDGHAVKMTETWEQIGVSPPQQSSSNKYQIWSSVLNSALTELRDDGEKETTKVFAGGAVIAEQMSPANSASRVEWITADPITGSSTRIVKSGIFEDVNRTELEPFGQEILTVDPDELDPEVILGDRPLNADEPEWRCAEPLNKNFWDKPAYCQIKDVENAGVFYAGGEKNPNRIADAGHPLSPTAHGKNLPVNSMPTDKPHDDSSASAEDGDEDLKNRIVTVRYNTVPNFIEVTESRRSDKLTQKQCDSKIAGLFGGEGAVVATALDPITITSPDSEKVNGINVVKNKVVEQETDRSYHLADNGAFHIYPDKYGTDNLEVGLYIPKGAKVKKLVGEYKQPDSGTLSNSFGFYFTSGEYEGVEIHFDHVGGTYGGNEGGQYLGKQFIDSKGNLIGSTNAAGSVQIGIIGGVGGRESPARYKPPLYRHTHIVVKKNGKRIDPRKVFCGW